MSEYLSDHVHLGDDLTSVVILDQTLLPNEVKYLTLRAPEEMFEAIQSLRVRGAPAIGICAGYCLAAIAQQRSRDLEHPRYLSELFIDLTDVAAPPAKIAAVLREEALAIHREDIAMCKSISEHGLTLLQDGAGVLTHCNAGPLATSQYGTALGPLLLGTQRGMRFRVFADACFVGCDRVAANGDAANKIGTSGVAILAKHYGIPFYVLGPTSTIDLDCPTGDDIQIELRDPEEIKSKFYARPMAPAGVKCYNPAFDVTEHSLIAGIVTERGICRPPYDQSLAALFH